ncbi:alpha/beta hydrolase-fold protein [Chitinophaga polysaccharea]|uniref:alpha/beta hydrolase-fold protein n=1 Tax=Chitinophaga polysaccharea TaxID=1293035 RepID=UPI00115A0BC6|nr:alpha/beta hydrolase-fold protein [Chitinophaga polysaccharea]
MKVFTIVLLLLVHITARSQDISPVKDSLFSTVLKETRPINVVFPKNYNPASPGEYEVIYCLGDIPDFLKEEWNMLQWEGFIPKNMILVGIPDFILNGVNMRERDLAPTKTGANSGEAVRFLQFFRDELMPYISKRYHAKPGGHTLYGGSMGGLFVMYTFLTAPGLFTSYIAIDPSLWWDDFYLHKLAAERFARRDTLDNTLFIAGREGAAFQFMGVAGMDSILKAKAPAGLDWKCVQYSNETHYSTNFKGFWEGMKFSYGGFYASTGGYPTSRKIVIKPDKGIVLSNKPFKLICYNLAADAYLHYTTDGTAPGISSPRITGEETAITINGDSKVIVASLGKRKEYNRSASAFFQMGEVFTAVRMPAGARPGGLRYKYYEGNWDTIPDAGKLKLVETGIATADFNLNKVSKKDNYALVNEGYIQISEPGYYIFEMGTGNEHTKVYLNNRLILGAHFKTGEGESFMVPLEKGFYPLRISYLHKKGGDDLQPVYLKTEGRDDFPLPANMLFSVK